MGSMREARCAGTNPAINAAAPSRAAMAASVAGSVGVVPKSSDAISLATTSEATIPSALRTAFAKIGVHSGETPPSHQFTVSVSAMLCFSVAEPEVSVAVTVKV